MKKKFDKIEKDQLAPIDEDVLEMAKKLVNALNYEKIDGGWAVSFNDTSELTSIIIPAYYKGEPVIKIADEGFFAKKNITSVTIPNTVINIGKDAFTLCQNLTSVTFEEDSQLKLIDESAFYNCSNLREITIPKNVERISFNAFTHCKNLLEVSFEYGNKLKELYQFAFYDCNNLKEFTIPSSVKKISPMVFTNCSSLTNISVDESNPLYKSIDGNLYTKDGKTLLQYAIGKTEQSFEIPNGVISLGSYAFDDSNLTTITIPDSVKVWGENTFACKNLQNLIFKDVKNWKHYSPEGVLTNVAPQNAVKLLKEFNIGTWIKF